MKPHPGWRVVARVRTFLDAHRHDLRALAVQRCPACPRRTLAEVHMVNGERWAWLSGTRLTATEVAERGIDSEDWVKVAASVVPLDARYPSRRPLSSCRKCKTTYVIDLDLLDDVTTGLPRDVVILPPPEKESRVLR